MRIAALQMQSKSGDIATNLARIRTSAFEAAEAGAHLLVAPELALTGYGAGDAISSLAVSADGEPIRQLAAIAAEAGIAIIAGFAERSGELIYNAAVFTDGRAAPAVYRKSHLYGDYERSIFTPGEPATCLVRHEGMTLAMLICYDVEFPENVRRLAVAGADMVVVPTALPEGPSGTFVAERMIGVRAFENQIFIAYVNHNGCDARFCFAGLSCIVAPDGSTLASAAPYGDALLLADVEPGDFVASRRENTYLADLR